MLLEDVASYLESQGLGTAGVDIFYYSMPDAPDNVIVLNEYGGEAPEYALGVAREYPRVQVKVRNASLSGGRLKAQEVNDALHNLRQIELNGTHYNRFLAMQSPEPVELSLGMTVFAQNFKISKVRG